MSELLALLGRFGPRLLYPGGLGLLALVWLLLRARRAERSAQLELAGLLGCAAPLLGLALVPLPGAVSLERDIDLLTVLLLLDVPLWLRVAYGQRHNERVAALTTLLNAYPVLVLAALAMASASGSLNVTAIGGAGGLTLGGAAAWALVIGGTTAPPASEGAVLVQASLLVRCLGHWLLAGALLLSVGTNDWPTLLRVALGLGLALLLMFFGGWLQRRAAWPDVLAWLGLALALWLMWLATTELVARLS